MTGLNIKEKSIAIEIWSLRYVVGKSMNLR